MTNHDQHEYTRDQELLRYIDWRVRFASDMVDVELASLRRLLRVTLATTLIGLGCIAFFVCRS